MPDPFTRSPGDGPAPSADDVRRARREWIAEHHPDRGGDPKVFAAGMARFARQLGELTGTRSGAGTGGGFRPSVQRSRSPVRRVQLALRRLRRRVRGQPHRNLH